MLVSWILLLSLLNIYLSHPGGNFTPPKHSGKAVSSGHTPAPNAPAGPDPVSIIPALLQHFGKAAPRIQRPAGNPGGRASRPRVSNPENVVQTKHDISAAVVATGPDRATEPAAENTVPKKHSREAEFIIPAGADPAHNTRAGPDPAPIMQAGPLLASNTPEVPGPAPYTPVTPSARISAPRKHSTGDSEKSTQFSAASSIVEQKLAKRSAVSAKSEVKFPSAVSEVSASLAPAAVTQLSTNQILQLKNP